MDTQRSVLVTGASTGIGRRIVDGLAAAGHRVYAGARKEPDLRALNAIDNVTAVRLDVTNAHDIEAAFERIAQAGHGLYGLVNNAGIATVGSVCESDPQELVLTMTVNAMAPYLVTRAFAPLIRAARGRIVMMGSIAGVLAEANLSAYSMSKHALEAFADVLSSELAPHGVGVSIIEPGCFRTELANNVRLRLGSQTQLPDLSDYSEPDEVARAVFSALFAHYSKRRYLVVTSESEARQTIQKQIEQLVQLNQEHTYTYSREALVTMLDAAIVQAAHAGTGSIAAHGSSSPDEPDPIPFAVRGCKARHRGTR